MTYVYRSTIKDGNYYQIEVDAHTGAYRVTVSEIQGGGLCGYPFIKNTYATKEQAVKRFHALLKRDL